MSICKGKLISSELGSIENGLQCVFCWSEFPEGSTEFCTEVMEPEKICANVKVLLEHQRHALMFYQAHAYTKEDVEECKDTIAICERRLQELLDELQS